MVSGIVGGDIRSNGGDLVLGGVTNGDVDARGGSVEITGIVSGVVYASRSTRIRKTATGIAEIEQR